jgi:hypothetical protein
VSKVLNEITVITGTYRNAQGQDKKRYQRIGSVIDTKNGPMLKLDVIPLKEGGWDGWAYINEPRPRDQAANGNIARPAGLSTEFIDDDLPNF